MTHLILTKIRTLLAFFLLQLLQKLVSVPDKRYKTAPYSKPYQPIEINPLPITKAKGFINYKQLLKQAVANGKPIKPVKHRGTEIVPKSLCCKFCNATSEYIYPNGHAPVIKNKKPILDHSGNKILVQQFFCKICQHTFRQFQERKSASFLCPFCNKSLVFVRRRKHFAVYKCTNKSCPYRKFKEKELSKVSDSPSYNKLSYIYREFLFDIKDLQPNVIANQKVDFARIHYPTSVVSLALAFYINVGISSRETARALGGIFGVSVSHQTIINWLNSCAYLLKPFFDNYSIECSKSIVGDETYIKIKGAWGYVFIIYDFKKSRIISIYTSLRRDTKAATSSLMEAINKTHSSFSEFISDANPIYQLAHQFFTLKNIHMYEHFIVRGLKNMDESSALYRDYKQAVERVIRTYKQRYNRTHGFKSFDGAITFNTLFGIYFNFMRPHEACDNLPPIQLPELNVPSYTEKWLNIISLAKSYHDTS